MAFQIVFSDIDGTLLNSQHEVTPLTQEAIRDAVEKGILFVPVSARMPRAIALIMEAIGVRTPIISYNGALLQDENGEVLASYMMETMQAMSICAFLEEQHPDIAWNIYSFQDWFAPKGEAYWVAREEDVVGIQADRVLLSDLQDLEGVHKVLLMGEPERIVELELILKARYPDLSIARSLPHLLEVMATGIEKGRAGAVFSEIKKVALSDTLAFGDNYNDLDMLKTVGTGVVMGNAPEAIRQQFAHVTDDHNHDGIAKALEELL